MIINTSRIHQLKECGQKTYFWNEENLKAHREDDNLLMGGGLHKALALINSKKVANLEQAADAAELEFRQRLGDPWEKLLPEERKLYAQSISTLRSMVKAYGEHYLEEKYEMLAPEVTFLIPLPNTAHHCWYFHRLLSRIAAGEDIIERTRVFRELGTKHQTDPITLMEFYKNSPWERCSGNAALPCWQPHYFTGTTDAVIQWSRVIYLLEHKTTAYDLYNGSGQSNHYIQQWQLNDQATGYIYGIWKSTKVRPHGVLLNVIIKPRKNASVPTFNFYREAFLRSDEDLLRFEKQAAITASLYEQTMRERTYTLNPSSCFNYNRECYYRQLCLGHRGPKPGEFLLRDPDYVENSYFKALGIPPKPKTEVPVEKP